MQLAVFSKDTKALGSGMIEIERLHNANSEEKSEYVLTF